ncbi:response regulator [Anaerobium acetethylicum]|uniref:Stage 0 sporulation protein A homolog n=1 Tax=Anaerobium acetethylicum TaxID=1619234 RepID=A0A1D3TQU9_9FIRM|nr:response regulator [Anaerobium acetethylicum]SCP96006.1 Two-component response regulator, SAPR family, consists of REC, wHTH and BTAD domains [Anaerobium acetethylicum]
MILIAAVDDERHVLERFERMVSEIEGVKLCGLFETGEELIEYMKCNPLDAVFLDIEMPGGNGMELAVRIQDLNRNIEIIFITAYGQYAVEAFDINALDYILKPLKKERLEKSIERIMDSAKEHEKEENPGKPYIKCFGDFEVIVDGEVLTWKNSKAREILAFLVYKKGVPVSWEKIADAVWPEYDSEKAQSNFHANTYLLRKRLSEAGIAGILENARGNYRIVADKIYCDAYQLEERLRTGHMKRKEDMELLDLFRNRGYMEAEGYEWAYQKSAELHELVSRLDL